MKKVTLIAFSVVFVLGTFASVPIKAPTELPKLKASEVMIPIGKTGKQISLLDLSKISRKDLENLTGRKMTLPERLSFPLVQKKLNKSIKPDGTIDNKKLNKHLKKSTGPTEGFHAVGFVLGFLLGLIGVLLAYIINDDEDKRNRVKWSWIGFAISVVIYLILILAVFASVNSLD